MPIWRIHRAIGLGGDDFVAYVVDDAAEEHSGDVEDSKPAPDLVEVAMEKAEGEDDAILIGDSVWDIEAAKRAGIGTLGVLTGGYSEAELVDAGAQAVFGSVKELLDRLGETPLGS